MTTYGTRRTLRPLSAPALWAGRTLRQWLPLAVDDVVREVAPQRIVLFGSVARGDEGPDSDHADGPSVG